MDLFKVYILLYIVVLYLCSLFLKVLAIIHLLIYDNSSVNL